MLWLISEELFRVLSIMNEVWAVLGLIRVVEKEDRDTSYRDDDEMMCCMYCCLLCYYEKIRLKGRGGKGRKFKI
jgi:hypothetical protein